MFFWNIGPVLIMGFTDDASGKESTCQCRRCKRSRFDPRVGKIPWRRKWQPTPVFSPEKSHGQRSLVCYSPWGCKESDMTEYTPTYYKFFFAYPASEYMHHNMCSQVITMVLYKWVKGDLQGTFHSWQYSHPKPKNRYYLAQENLKLNCIMQLILYHFQLFQWN